MSGTKTNRSRRAFFTTGGAVLGAGVATTVAAANLTSDSASPLEEQLTKLRQQLAGMEDREAIRQLQREFTTLVVNQAYESAAELFDEQAHLNLSGVSATGKLAILQLFVDQYRHQKAAANHSAYRQSDSQHKDAVTVSEDRQQAAATFHTEVELCTPLQGDCTVAQMARLQGHVADRRWETGRFEAKYVRTRGQWRMLSLSYLST
jgi:SnoaL-like domain